MVHHKERIGLAENLIVHRDTCTKDSKRCSCNLEESSTQFFSSRSNTALWHGRATVATGGGPCVLLVCPISSSRVREKDRQARPKNSVPAWARGPETRVRCSPSKYCLRRAFSFWFSSSRVCFSLSRASLSSNTYSEQFQCNLIPRLLVHSSRLSCMAHGCVLSM